MKKHYTTQVNMTLEEIAKIEGITKQGVCNIIRKALKKLRKKMKKYEI